MVGQSVALVMDRVLGHWFLPPAYQFSKSCAIEAENGT